jgi:hypothetical protein
MRVTPFQSPVCFSDLKFHHPETRKNEHRRNWWHFDAVSDDSNSLLVILITNDYPYRQDHQKPLTQKSPAAHPAVSLTFIHENKKIARLVNLFPTDSISISNETVRIGDFALDSISTPYGTGLRLNGTIKDEDIGWFNISLEWLAIEADLSPAKIVPFGADVWNIAMPRADVTGEISFLGRNGEKHFRFHGTGYHDRRSSDRESIIIRNIFRSHCHFSDKTVVAGIFGNDEGDSVSEALIIENNELHQPLIIEHTGQLRLTSGKMRQHFWSFESQDQMLLKITQKEMFDTGGTFVRGIADFELTEKSDLVNKGSGLFEMVRRDWSDPGWAEWLADIGLVRR